MLQQLRRDRDRGRRHPGDAEAGPSSDRRLRAQRLRARLPPGVSRGHVLLPARRHRDPDPELRTARADRRADRGQRPGGQPRRWPTRCSTELRQVPGLADLRIQQTFDYPNFHVTVDRTKARERRLHPARCGQQRAGHARAAASRPTRVQFLNWQNGVSYNVVTQAPQYTIQSLQDLQNIPITAPAINRPADPRRRGLDLPHAAAWPWSRTTTFAAWSTSTARCRIAISARWPATSRASWTPIGTHLPRGQLHQPARPDPDHAHVVHRPARRPGLRHRAGLSADRRELPVLARSVHHHHGAARRARRHRRVPVPDPHHAERARADGRHHVHGGRPRPTASWW